MLYNYNMLKVAGIFFDEPTAHHYLIEISRKSNLAHTSVKLYLDNLKKDEIIIETSEKRGKRKFPYFIANINNSEYKSCKKIYNLIQLYNLNILDALKDKLMPKSIVLFGSYAKGEDIETSDIDLFIESKRNESKDIEDIINKFEGKLRRKIQIHFNERFSNYPKELRNNIINGIILYGYLDAIK